MIKIKNKKKEHDTGNIFFQHKSINWSNLYLGNIALTIINQIATKTVLILKIIKLNHIEYSILKKLIIFKCVVKRLFKLILKLKPNHIFIIIYIIYNGNIIILKIYNIKIFKKEGKSQPPKKKIIKIAEFSNILVYSPKKNKAKLIEEYSRS